MSERETSTSSYKRYNPYVGPRAFEEGDRENFFGRNREARELLSLVISEPLVLFYAQSGTGKSSLLNTHLIPSLREENFHVLPKGRVGGKLPQQINTVDNIFIFNLLVSLDQGQEPLAGLTDITLTDYLQSHKYQLFMEEYYDETEYIESDLPDDSAESIDDEAEYEYDDELYEEIEGPPRALIIDQFEEIITNHPERWAERKAFFEQLAQAMSDDSSLWVIISMREDYLASLDPYASILPGKFRAKFRLEPLKRAAALKAITQPAALINHPFAPGVAESLVDNLRRIQSGDEANGVQHELGEYIEPVHLQIVCQQLWENLPADSVQVRPEDVQMFGDVDQALIGFYEKTIQQVVELAQVSQRSLRTWVSTHLITPAETRGLVYRDRYETAGLPNQALDILHEAYIVRGEVRGKDTWYELTHDRMVEPILKSNRRWREKHRNPLNIAASTWLAYDKDPKKLLRGEQLREAKLWAKRYPDQLSSLEKEYIVVSLEAGRRRSIQRTRATLLLAVLVGLALSLLTVFALSQAYYANNQRITAEAASTLAIQQKITAEAASTYALQQQATALQAEGDAEDLYYQAATSESGAVAQQKTAEAASTDAITQKETAVAEKEEAINVRSTSISNQEARLTAAAERDVLIGDLKTREAEINNLSGTITVQKNVLALLPTRALLSTADPGAAPTPTPTATPTPNIAATATQVALEQELINTQATQTAEYFELSQQAIAEEQANIQATQTAEHLSLSMVAVPPGSFEMGFVSGTNNVGDFRVQPESDEQPSRTINLASFWIDRTEVTNAAYRECIGAGVCQPQQGGDPAYHRASQYNNHPAIFVSWNDANIYCQWVGKRLPTEAEWEKAARGTDNRVWAWGNFVRDDPTEPIERANLNGSVDDGPTSILQYTKGVSPYGATHMTGNVWEWVSDWYSATYYQTSPVDNPTGPTQAESNGRKVIRGGAFNTEPDDARTDERNALTPNTRSIDVGFRCAISY